LIAYPIELFGCYKWYFSFVNISRLD